MRSLRLHQPGVCHVIAGPVPEPGADEVRLRVVACGLCRTDAKLWRSGHRDLVLPRVPGHEICALDHTDGRRYVPWPGRACGACQACRAGLENLCPHMRILGFHVDGGLAEEVCVPRTALVPLPETLPDDVATLAEPLACCLNGWEQAGRIAGEPVLVIGGGPVGLLAAFAARAAGAIPFVLERSPTRLAQSAVLREAWPLPTGTVLPRGEFAACLTATGDRGAVGTALSGLRPGGCCVAFSGLGEDGPLPAAAWNDLHYRQLHAVGAYGCTRAQLRRAVALLAAHAVTAARLITRTVDLETVPDAFAAVLAGTELKVVALP